MYLCLVSCSTAAGNWQTSVSSDTSTVADILLHMKHPPCAQVLLCDGRGQTGRQRQLTRFKDRAYSGCYRADGQLLVAGGESGLVQVGALHNTNT